MNHSLHDVICETVRIDRQTLAAFAKQAGFGGVDFHTGAWLMESFERFAALVQSETIKRIEEIPELTEEEPESPVHDEEWR